ncbi:MAG: metal-dependent hydrolase [Candidatus Manganitrophaceae bacterium]
MDNVTHTLVGVAMANAFFRKRIGKGAVPILAIASNLPDIDAFVVLTGDPTAILMRRTFGHSLLLLPIWVFILSLIFRRFYPEQRFGTLFGLTLLGAGVHLFFDLVNSFGVVLLWPFSDWRPELGIVFIIDLFLTGVLAAPLFLSRLPLFKTTLARLSQCSILIASLYIGLCGVARIKAGQFLEKAANGPVDFRYVFPEPLGPHRWKGVSREGNTYRIYLINPITGRVDLREEEKTEIDDLRVVQAREKPLARRLEWFFKAPVWQVEKDPKRDPITFGEWSGEETPTEMKDAVLRSPSQPIEVRVYDLRFKTILIGRTTPFVFRFKVEPAS